jgi:AmmeMemoRadiSam system protein A
MLSEADRRELLRIARDSVVSRVRGRLPARVLPAGELARPAGAFVSIHRHGDLRGCIGHVEPDQPLAQVVSSCAAAACSSDPRFPALTESELPHVNLELSVLGLLEPVETPEEVEVGRHGLVVEMGWRRGLLLPQVATEWGWDRRTFLEQTCRKAGLPGDAWQHGATLWKFEAEVFGESAAVTAPSGNAAS